MNGVNKWKLFYNEQATYINNIKAWIKTWSSVNGMILRIVYTLHSGSPSQLNYFDVILPWPEFHVEICHLQVHNSKKLRAQLITFHSSARVLYFTRNPSVKCGYLLLFL